MLTSGPLLELEAVTVDYGHVSAVAGVSLEVGEREMVALLGANGAGKSSLLRALSGEAGRVAGTVRLQGESIGNLSPHRKARLGVAHVMEGRRVIGPMSVRDNLLLAAGASGRARREEIPDLLEEVYTYFPRLKERESQASGLLSGGEQQMLAISRGIMAKPQILLLDEPSMGLAPIVIEEIYEFLRERTGTLAQVAILLAEQSAALALSVSERAYVLARGKVVHHGASATLSESVVAQAYLGAGA